MRSAIFDLIRELTRDDLEWEGHVILDYALEQLEKEKKMPDELRRRLQARVIEECDWTKPSAPAAVPADPDYGDDQ